MASGKDESKQDRAVEDSFPASDPPATSGIVGPRLAPRRPAPAKQRSRSRPNSTIKASRRDKDEEHSSKR